MKLILMLEDDFDRISRFRSIMANKHPGAVLNVSRRADGFIAEYLQLQVIPNIVCLDHDLYTDSPDEEDPGDGRDVSNFLITQKPSCPVLIHSTNSDAADSMMYSMLEAGWNVDRISPLGDDWIETYWYPFMLKMISTSGGTTA